MLALSPSLAQLPADAGGDDAALDDCQSTRPARAIRGCTALLERTGAGEIRGGMRANILTNRAESRLDPAGGVEADADRALADADKAIALDARNDRAHAARGRALALMGRDAEAVASFTTAIGLDPRTVAVMLERARASARLRQDSAAEADFREAIRRRFNRPEPYLAHAEFLMQRAGEAGEAPAASPRMTEARRDLDKAVQYGFTQAAPYAARARWYERTGNDAEALRDLDRAIAVDETFGLAYLERGRINARLGRTDAARQDAEQAVFKAAGVPEVVDFAKRVGVATQSPGEVARKETAPAKDTPVKEAAVPAQRPPRDERPRVALVIGNGTYKDPENSLPNALNDARDVSAKLRGLGFDVVEAFDKGKAELADIFETFETKAAASQAVLIYYAGHGFGEAGRSFIVPVDADLGVGDLRGQLVDIAKLVFDTERVAPVVMLFLDACRTPPSLSRPPVVAMAQGRQAQVGQAEGGDTRGSSAPAATDAPERSRALAAIKTVGQETLVVYATAPGRTAADGAGRNSPFTKAFLGHVATPGMEVQAMIKRITREVRQATNNRQSPESLAQMASDFYFVPAP